MPLLLESFVTVAASFAVAPTCTVATAVESETLMGGRVTEGACAPPPPQPERTRLTSAAASLQRPIRRNELAIAAPPSSIAKVYSGLLSVLLLVFCFTPATQSYSEIAEVQASGALALPVALFGYTASVRLELTMGAIRRINAHPLTPRIGGDSGR